MPPQPEVIDLTLDSDDDEAPQLVATRQAQQEATPEEERDLAPEAVDLDAYDENYPMPGQFEDPPFPARGDLRNVPLVIDDFGYMDEEPQEDAGAEQEQRDQELARNLDEQPQILTQDDCLARVYEMFPDVCPEHTLSVYNQVGEDAAYELPVAVRLDRIIEKLIADAPYPKRKKDNQHLKRKREEAPDEEYKRWERDDREGLPRFLTGSIRSILKAEFPTFTHANINEIVTEERYLFKSYVQLAKMRDTDGNPRRGRPSMDTNADTIIANSGWPPLGEELAAARKRAQEDRVFREKQEARKQAEADNLQRSIARGRIAECQACFDELPMNRQVHCHGDEPHFTCFSCIETYIKTEIGDSRCRVLCTAGCGAGFDSAQLNLIADKKLLRKLADLQQEQDIRDAGLEDLEECPFCDFKAIMPPIEENFLFNCQNPECEKVSCRRCKLTSHIPISCEQYAKEQKANSRHVVEEAMTAALIRSCNKCKKQFIKEYGCNKMTCPSCRNLQCYVCSETLKGYDHFDQTPTGDPRPGGKCPLYDNLEQRHEREIKAAEETAKAQVMANNPDVDPEDLEIKLSDAVKQSTAQKIQRAGPEGLGGGPIGFGGGAMAMNAILDIANQPQPFAQLAGRQRHFIARPHLDVAGQRRHRERINELARQQRDLQNAQEAQRERELAQERIAQEYEAERARHAARWRRMLDQLDAYRVPPPALRRPVRPPFVEDEDEEPMHWRPFFNPFPDPVEQEAPPPRMVDPFDDGFPLLGPQVGWPEMAPLGVAPQNLQPPLQPQPQQMVQPHAIPANGQNRPFQLGRIPDGFAIRPRQHRPVPRARDARPPPPLDYMQLAHDYNPAPADAVPDGREEARLANVARNLHQLELMRQEHDARNGNLGADNGNIGVNFLGPNLLQEGEPIPFNFFGPGVRLDLERRGGRRRRLG